MNRRARLVLLLAGVGLIPLLLLPMFSFETIPEQAAWPAKNWLNETPTQVGMDEKILTDFAADLGSGKYGLIDSFDVFRCGRQIFHRTYSHDYAVIYGKQAKVRGPLNARLTGPYNYFDPAWHPYYNGTQLHSMQSVSKTVTSVILGIAITRGDFKSNLDTPVLHYFDVTKVKYVDDRKKRITLQNVLTMSTGLNWNEENVAYDDPRSDSSLMEATDDYHWKRCYLGVVDTEGGLYLRGEDLAKIGYLYLHGGVWRGQRIVSEEFVKQSLTPRIDAEFDMKYGYKWWLYPRKEHGHFIWMCLGFGGQRLMVFPEEQLIVVFTGWEILKDTAPISSLVARVLPAVQTPKCPAANH